MRTLCLHLPSMEQTGLVEAFVGLSPRIQHQCPDFIFADIESTSGLLGGEDRLLNRALEIAAALGCAEARAAIADHPPVAQVLALHKPGTISPFGEDKRALAELPLEVLGDLEGLKAWPQRRRIEHIAGFFGSLGLTEVSQLYNFDIASFRERWGETGVLLWRRLHGLDTQPLAPFIPQEPFKAYSYFDDPASLLYVIEDRLAEVMNVLFLRLAGLGRFAQRIEITLYCEYSDARHKLVVEPVSPSRDFELFLDLLHKRLEKTDLLNPVREFEIELFDVSEKVQQLDFFEPRNGDQDRWQRLISFAKQAEVEVGFLEPLPRHFPEDSYHLKADWPKLLSNEDHVERVDNAVQVKAVYAKALSQAPRPSLLLEKPVPLSSGEMKRVRRLSAFPMERIESPWWERMKEAMLKNETATPRHRDYYFALGENGEMLWIYQDRLSKTYYLHGYFD